MKRLGAKFIAIIGRLKFRLILTYLAVILISVAVIRGYVLTEMSSALYNDNKVNLMTKINIIATDIADTPESSIGKALEADIALLAISSDNRIIITNTDAVVIYDNAVKSYANSVGKVRLSPMILSALYGESTYNKVENEDGITTAASVPIKKNDIINGVVYIETSADEIGLMLETTRNRVDLITIVLSIIAVLISVIFAGIFTSPIEKLIKKIKSQKSDRKMKIDIVANGEIGELVKSFNELIEELEAQEEKRTAFVSNASHELKTPLSSIKLICDSVLASGDNVPQEMIHEFLNDMNEEVDRLTVIINDLLDLTRMDSARYNNSIKFVTGNLKDVVRGVVSSLAKIAIQRGVTLNFNGNNDVFMLMEENKIWEAVYNITDNAIKYTPYGGKVEVFLEKDIHNAIITITDSGIGISKNEISKIFDRFYRVDKARSRETGGTGLGLSIALSAVEMHEGHIDVESEEGVGSVFRIYLPLA